jgi:3-hydroxyacyl-CoA dehydrogenase
VSGPLAPLGPGVLGLSTAQWAAGRGLAARLLGRDADHAARGRAKTGRRWQTAVQKGRLDPADRAESSARLESPPFGPSALDGAATFPEAVEAKVPVLALVVARRTPGLPTLSSTSSPPISDLAERAGLCVGQGFCRRDVSGRRA